mgnify:CR=1 FL=1
MLLIYLHKHIAEDVPGLVSLPKWISSMDNRSKSATGLKNLNFDMLKFR